MQGSSDMARAYYYDCKMPMQRLWRYREKTAEKIDGENAAFAMASL